MSYLVILKVDHPTDVKLSLSTLTREDLKQSMVGVYQLPRNPPTCAGTCKTSKKFSGWGRKPDKGYIVHDCGRRHPDWLKRVTGALFDNLGRNLLRRPPKEFQNPRSW